MVVGDDPMQHGEHYKREPCPVVRFVELLILGEVFRGKTDGIFSNILLKQCNFSREWPTILG